jgi:hypothetical protein
VHRLPDGADGNPDVALGLHLYQNKYMDTCLWPLISSIEVLLPAQMGQFGTAMGKSGFSYTMARSSIYGIIRYTSNNPEAKICLENLINKNALKFDAHPSLSGLWGQYRMFDTSGKNFKACRLPLYKYSHAPFPKTLVHHDRASVIHLDNGARFSFDHEDNQHIRFHKALHHPFTLSLAPNLQSKRAVSFIPTPCPNLMLLRTPLTTLQRCRRPSKPTMPSMIQMFISTQFPGGATAMLAGLTPSKAGM